MSDPEVRCARLSQGRGESQAGTASHVRAFLLVEQERAWGAKASIPGVTPPPGVKLLFIRRHGRSGQREGGAAAVGGVRVVAAYAGASSRWMEEGELPSLEAVADLDLDALRQGRSVGLRPAAGPLYLVCTHGKHDVCCAERGRPVAAALAARYHAETWEVSHIGGDRFAGNMLLLPDGLYFGRLEPASALEVVAAHRRGELVLDLLRGRSSLPMPVQAAEIGLRAWADEHRSGAVTWLRHEPGDPTTAWFDLAGSTYAVRVRTRHDGAPQRLTCGAVLEQVPPSYDVVDIRPVDG